MCDNLEDLGPLFEKNRRWVQEKLMQDPAYFDRLSAGHAPQLLWIGCSDSRVPANVIAGLEPGEVFVHRNIANLINSADMNALSVIEYAVEVLGVSHIIVAGHYDCGGVKAALSPDTPGMVAHWVRSIRKYALWHKPLMAGMSKEAQINYLCEVNVREQVRNLCHIPAVRRRWEAGHYLQLSGLIYDIRHGLLKDLEVSICSEEDADRFLLRVDDEVP